VPGRQPDGQGHPQRAHAGVAQQHRPEGGRGRGTARPPPQERAVDEVEEVEDDAAPGEAGDHEGGHQTAPGGEQVGDVKLGQVEGDAAQAHEHGAGGQGAPGRGRAADEGQARHVEGDAEEQRELGAEPVQDGPDEDGPGVEGEDADRPDDGQPVFLGPAQACGGGRGRGREGG
jgi:hypothetical protein